MSPMYMAALRQAVELGQITLFDDLDLRLLAASPLVGADASGSTSADRGGSAKIMSASQAVSSAAAPWDSWGLLVTGTALSQGFIMIEAALPLGGVDRERERERQYF